MYNRLCRSLLNYAFTAAHGHIPSEWNELPFCGQRTSLDSHFSNAKSWFIQDIIAGIGIR